MSFVWHVLVFVLEAEGTPETKISVKVVYFGGERLISRRVWRGDRRATKASCHCE